MSVVHQQLRELVVSDIRQRYPHNSDKADAIVDRLLEMQQMQSDDSIIAFINSYRCAVEKRDNGLQR